MTDIRKQFLKSFTVKELMQFIDYYIEHKEMLHVPGHPRKVCDLVARFLGFGYSRQWSQDEIDILTVNYPPLGAEKTSELLLMRTAYDCKEKADHLGLYTSVKPDRKKRRSRWSVSELNILTKYYPIIGPKAIVLLPGRTETACCNMAYKLGLTRKGRAFPGRTPWTEDELRILRDAYPKSGVSGVQKLLPNRSSLACSNMAIRLGLTTKRSKEQIKWSDAEIEILKEHYPDMGKDVTRLLPGRTAATCCCIASELGLSIRGHYWSEEEDAILREYYPREGKKVSQRLPNRGETSCDSRARRLGLCRMKSTDAAVPKAEKPLDDDQSCAKLSLDADDTTEDQTMEENTALTQIETPQTGDDIDEEQQEEPSSMRFGSMHM